MFFVWDREVQLPVPLDIHTHTHIYTLHIIIYKCACACVYAYARVRVCVFFISTKKSKVYRAGPMDKSGITTLVGFSLRENEREKENNKILHTSTGYTLYYTLLCHAFYSFVHAVTRSIYYSHNSFWCSFFRWVRRTFRRTCSENRTIHYIVATYERPVCIRFEWTLSSIVGSLYICRFSFVRYNGVTLRKRPRHSFTTKCYSELYIPVILVINKCLNIRSNFRRLYIFFI